MIRMMPLYSGSNGNSTMITDGKTTVLVDGGLSGRAIENAVVEYGGQPSALSAIFVTHEHIDHVKAVGVLSRRYHLPIYATEGTWQGMEPLIGSVASQNIKIADEAFSFQSLHIETTPISHDAAQPVAYSFSDGDGAVTVATDIGVMTDGVAAALKKSRMVLLESNHDEEMLLQGSYPPALKFRIKGERGHLSNSACAKTCVALAKSGVQTIVLGHLSKENNRPELAYSAAYHALSAEGVEVGKDVRLFVARRFEG